MIAKSWYSALRNPETVMTLRLSHAVLHEADSPKLLDGFHLTFLVTYNS